MADSVWWHRAGIIGQGVIAVATVALVVVAISGLRTANQVYHVRQLEERAAEAETQAATASKTAREQEELAKKHQHEAASAQKERDTTRAVLAETKATLRGTEAALKKAIADKYNVEIEADRKRKEAVQREREYGQQIWVYVADQYSRKLKARQFPFGYSKNFSTPRAAELNHLKWWSLFSPEKERGEEILREVRLRDELNLLKLPDRKRFEDIVTTFIDQNSVALSEELIPNFEKGMSKDERSREWERVSAATKRFDDLVDQLHKELLEAAPS